MRRLVPPTLLVLLFTACATVPTETLYFGSNRDHVRVVGETEWATFLRDVVDAHLKGYTWYAAHGVWEGEREETYVLIVVGDGQPRLRERLDCVVHAYRVRFGQEAVLRVRTRARKSLHDPLAGQEEHAPGCHHVKAGRT